MIATPCTCMEWLNKILFLKKKKHSSHRFQSFHKISRIKNSLFIHWRFLTPLYNILCHIFYFFICNITLGWSSSVALYSTCYYIAVILCAVVCYYTSFTSVSLQDILPSVFFEPGCSVSWNVVQYLIRSCNISFKIVLMFHIVLFFSVYSDLYDIL